MINQPLSASIIQPYRTRSISAENPTGANGQGGRATHGVHSTAYASSDLPIGWKKSPCVDLAPNSTVTVADITGSGVIQHIWITALPKFWRNIVIRITFDGAETPAIAAPLGDLFCMGWGEYAPVSSMPITVAPAGGLNSYWEMPFKKSAVITVENLTDHVIEGFFHQTTWSEQPVPEEAGYLHAQWRRSDPLTAGEPHTLLEVEGKGHYIGTYLAWETHSRGWWGEGEVKFYLDEDEDFPSICGTGTEDYFGGAWAFEHPKGVYSPYSSPWLGMPQVIEPDGFYRNQQRFGLYRWHLPDPIRFQERLRATVQALGFHDRPEGHERYKPLSDDIASTCWWYSDNPGGTPGTEMTRDSLGLN